jgi:O-antigen/teichoic acid export membrane protein
MSSKARENRRFSSHWRDVVWQLSGTSLAQLVGIAGIPVLTRLYTPEDFAVQSLFLQVVTYATALVTWRYEYFVQLPKSDDDVRALNRLVLMLGCFTVLVSTPLLWMFRDVVAAQLGNSDVASWLILAPMTAVLFSWSVAIQNNAQRRGDFKTSGLSELIGKLAYVSTGIVGALAHLGAAGLVITSGASAIGKGAFGIWRQPARGRGTLQVEVGAVLRVRSRYGRLATSTVLAHVLSTSAIALPQVAMARLYGADILGQFALVMATIFLPTGLIGVAVGHVYYQRAARTWAEGAPFVTLWREMALKLLMMGVPVYALVALLSGVAYPFVFGDQWDVAGGFATWMAAAAFVSFVSTPMDRTCLIVGAGSYLVLWSVCRLVLTVVVVWLATALEFSPSNFVMAIAVQMCVALIVDFWAGYKFSQGQLGVFAYRFRASG